MKSRRHRKQVASRAEADGPFRNDVTPSGFTLLEAGAAYTTEERPSDYQSVGVEVAFDSNRGARCQNATGLMNSFKRVWTWPKVIYDQCNVTLDVWRKMESTGPHLDFFNTTYNFRYRCWKCVFGRRRLY